MLLPSSHYIHLYSIGEEMKNQGAHLRRFPLEVQSEMNSLAFPKGETDVAESLLRYKVGLPLMNT